MSKLDRDIIADMDIRTLGAIKECNDGRFPGSKEGISLLLYNVFDETCFSEE